MTKIGKTATKLWNKMKEPKVTVKFTCGISIIFIIIAAILVGVLVPMRNTIDTSMVEKLGHYQKAGSTRSSDYSNPAIVTDSNCRLLIEIECPEWIYNTDGFAGDGDIWIVFGMSPQPVASLEDYITDGTLIDEIFLSANDMRTSGYMSGDDGTYFTHLSIEWTTGLPNLLENQLYGLYVDFYDTNDVFHTCPELIDFMPVIDMLGQQRPRMPSASLSVQIETTTPVPPAEPDLSNCAFISFFEYDPTGATATPTPTTGTGDGIEPTAPGDFDDGVWYKEDPFFANIAEQFTVNTGATIGYLAVIILLLILLILLIVFAIKQKKKK